MYSPTGEMSFKKKKIACAYFVPYACLLHLEPGLLGAGNGVTGGSDLLCEGWEVG